MRTRQRIHKSDAAPGAVVEETKPTHRLTGISVDEVSIVDRAANQRQYLVVKHDKTAEGAAVDKAFPPQQGGAPMAPPAAPHAAPAAAPAPAPGGMQISPEVKARTMQVLQQASAKITALSQVLAGAVETPGAQPPQELMNQLAAIAALFAPAAAATPPAAPQVAPPAGAPPAFKEEATETSKAGRKLSQARLNQLQGVKDSLDALLADVSGTVEDETESDAKDESKPAEAKKTAAPAPELTEVKESLAAIVGAVSKMTTAIEGQNKRIADLQKARGESRQLNTDPPASVEKSTKVVWDLDMARPAKNYQ